jgi:release factor glutamine methyltransferase
MKQSSVASRLAETVGSALAQGTARLSAAGIAEPRLDAELLLADQLAGDRLALYREPARALPPVVRRRFDRLLQRRASGEPLQYLRGRTEFFGLECEVRPGALIPRADTEVLVELAVDRLARVPRLVDQPVRFADVGTGSGCIAVSIAVAVEHAVGMAIDSSVRALTVARRNINRHGLADRIIVRRGDLCEPLRRETWRVELIAANLPYIPRGAFKTLEPQIRDHEPRLALDGGPDGLTVIDRLVRTAADSLLPGGWLLLEVGIGQAGRVADYAQQVGWRVETIERDLAGIDRVVVLSKGA